MASKDPKILNIKKRWFRRPVITLAEAISSVAVFVAIAVTGLWFFKQKDNYDPVERDLDPTLLVGSKTRELYVRPAKIWQAPGTSIAGPQKPDIAPFPENILDEQWQASGRIRQFQAENLFEKINGEAEKFLKQNFKDLHYLVLKSVQDESEIAIELFDHQDLKSSIGIFSGHVTANNELLNAGSVNYFRTGAGLIGRKGRFFFRVTTADLNASTQAKIDQLSEGFADLEESADEFPLEYQLLSDTFNIPGTLIGYVTQNAFQYDFANDFWFGTLQNENNAQIFIHSEGSEEESRALYTRLIEELSYDYETVESDAQSRLLKHRFLENYFVLHQSGRYVFGVDKLTTRSKAPELMSALQEGIDDIKG